MNVMEDSDRFRRFTGVTAILAGLLAIASGVFGAAAWLDAFSIIFNLEPLFLVALSAVLLLIPVWTLWLGIDLLKRPA